MAGKVSVKLNLAMVIVVVAVLSAVVYAHCQIPCGIYNDRMRFDMLTEHIATIEKSIKQITELSGAAKPDMNQIVRWITNKDKHADDAGQIITYYFLVQRIKPVDKADSDNYQRYIDKLTLLHQMLVYTMKTKQSTDLANVEKLRGLLTEFQTAYSESDTHTH